MPSLTELTDQLRNVLRERREDYVRAAETVIAEIAKIDDPAVIPALISCFDDKIEQDELMFSIVHAIERWDDRTYSRAVLSTVEPFWKNSPRWAQIVHLRILNSDATIQAYLKELDGADTAQRAIVRDVYSAVAKRWPKLAPKAQPIVERLQ